MKLRNPVPIRRKAREWTLSVLYQIDIRKEKISRTNLEDFCNQMKGLDTDLGQKERDKISGIAEKNIQKIIDHLPTIDKVITANVHHWRLERMPIVDRNLIRLAVYEILYLDDIPPAVSINEAIEIAKIYGSSDSAKFVNGVLDKIKKIKSVA